MLRYPAPYLYPPLKRKFTSVVRITALVILACAKFKRKLYLKKIERKEKNIEDLKTLDFKEPKFSLFQVLAQIDQEGTGKQSNIVDYFSINGFPITDTKCKGRVVKLDDDHLSASLDYLFRKTSEELDNPHRC